MISMIRTTALAAALTLGCAGAMADQVFLDFTELGSKLTDTSPPTALPEAQGEDRLLVKNAFVYADNMLDDFIDQVPGDSSDGGFIMNRSRDPFSLNSIEISLRALAGSGQYFQSLTALVFSPTKIEISWFKRGGTQKFTRDLSDGTQQNLWTTSIQGTHWDAADQVDRISISAGPGAFGIDNLRIGLTGSTDPNPAPEPASYALVGLALLAAGAATRRRT